MTIPSSHETLLNDNNEISVFCFYSRISHCYKGNAFGLAISILLDYCPDLDKRITVKITKAKPLPLNGLVNEEKEEKS